MKPSDWLCPESFAEQTERVQMPKAALTKNVMCWECVLVREGQACGVGWEKKRNLSYHPLGEGDKNA